MASGVRKVGFACFWLASAASAADWPQFRGPAMDGTTPEPIATTWNTSSPGFVVWTNKSLTNGFSSFAVSQGRAFTQMSKGTTRLEYCVAVDAATGVQLWSRAIGSAPWDPNSTGNGGEGRAPCNRGDGPRPTPTVKDGRVYALSGINLHLVCCNATNGALIWSNNLAAVYGGSTADWDNGASPRLDGNLIFVNLNTATAGATLAAFNVADGSLAWQSYSAAATHSTPVVATIEGVRQVIFATFDGLASLERDTGEVLWTYPYPYGSVSVAMGCSPVVSSNIVFVTLAYTSGGSAAIRLTRSGTTWSVTQLWSANTAKHKSTWMTPVCYEGFVYGQFSDKGWTNSPLNCIDLATGTVKWSVPNFGMGGIILVQTNLLVVTEDGQVVLVSPNPAAYTELARYRAFQFTTAAPGKCWNSAAYSDGRLYLRSTRGAVSLDVAPPLPPSSPLVFHPPQLLSATQLQLVIGTSNGTPITAARLPNIEVRATNTLTASVADWPKLPLPLSLQPSGFAVLTNAISDVRTQLYYIAIEK